MTGCAWQHDGSSGQTPPIFGGSSDQIPPIFGGIAVALAQAIDELEEGRWVSGDTVGYVRTGGGKEIDLGPTHVPTSAGTELTVPIEGKWVDSGWRAEAQVVEKKYGRGVLATKSILDMANPAWAIPAPLLALLLR